jgi:uncharacterized protein (DUF427 family)
MVPWKHKGVSRPGFADEPGPGQESVWDYPRPPALRFDSRRILVCRGDLLVADTTHAVRVLETASPPTFYLPPGDVAAELLQRVPDQNSWCEWKGAANYYDLTTPDGLVPQVAWRYLEPLPVYALLAGYYSFYPGRIECYVDGERVRAQPGGYYGGWLTAEIAGPVKGEHGTGGW